MRSKVFLLCLLLSGTAFGQLYRWVDKDGTVHYSDTPHPEAEELDLPEPQTYDGGRLPAARPAAPQAPAGVQGDGEPGNYALVQITRPVLDQTFWNVGGQIPVSISLEPTLKRGDRVRLYLDDQPVEDFPTTGTSHVLSEVWRGSHTLRVEVIDASGQVLAQSEMVVFHVRQTSVVG